MRRFAVSMIRNAQDGGGLTPCELTIKKNPATSEVLLSVVLPQEENLITKLRRKTEGEGVSIPNNLSIYSSQHGTQSTDVFKGLDIGIEYSQEMSTIRIRAEEIVDVVWLKHNYSLRSRQLMILNKLKF
jgi:hypothetical protein